jgi:hypothetical protein
MVEVDDWMPTLTDDELFAALVGRMYDAGLRAAHIQATAKAVLAVALELSVQLAERLAEREVQEADDRAAAADARKQELADIAKSWEGENPFFAGAVLPDDWRTMDAEQLNEAIDARTEEVADGEE